LIAVFVLLVVGCGGRAERGVASPTSSKPGPIDTAVADPPMPEHVTFAPGETISAPGKAGVFFVDPKTGAGDGWVYPMRARRAATPIWR
jgi:hypothetical protein